MQTITVEYLMRLGACWSAAKLREAAKLWPSPSPSWAWFLGDRLTGMHRAEMLERVHVALAHVMLQKITLPMAPGELAELCKNCGEPELLALCEALGELLDVDPEHPHESDAAALDGLKAAIIAAKPSGIIEAKP